MLGAKVGCVRVVNAPADGRIDGGSARLEERKDCRVQPVLAHVGHKLVQVGRPARKQVRYGLAVPLKQVVDREFLVRGLELLQTGQKGQIVAGILKKEQHETINELVSEGKKKKATPFGTAVQQRERDRDRTVPVPHRTAAVDPTSRRGTRGRRRPLRARP